MTSITFSEERDEETCCGYCDQYQPHAARRIYDQENGMLYDFRWDKAGNLGQISLAGKEALFKSGRFLFWTEDNRLHTAVDEKHYSYYVYDHSGERRVKLTGESEWLDANANLMLTGTLLYKPTLYPSPYLVLSMNEYTKHYYAGAERVAACLGGGGLDIVLGNNLTEPTAPAYSTPWGGLFDNGSTDPEEVIVNDTIVMLQEASTKLFEQSGWQVNQRELNGNELNCIAEIDAYHAELHRTIAGIPDRMEIGITLDFDKFHDKVRDLKKIQHDEREYVYYYHGDHLGSASWITDHDGNPVQHLRYLPYGEPYVDQRTIGYSERFRFTGKEKDEETGYGYFGARYMDHELTTMWLSVDPMADKYQSISPYAYCMWNPIKVFDPNGMDTLIFSWNQSKRRADYEETRPGGDNIGIIKRENGTNICEFTFVDDRDCARFRKMDDMELSCDDNNLKADRDHKLLNSVILVNPDFVESCIEKAGANKWYRRYISYLGLGHAALQSRDGVLDFVNDSRINNRHPYSLFITTVDGESIAHNQWNFGNFIWGAAMARMFISPAWVWIGSNTDNFLHHFPYFDSKDDQKSIWQGYKYGLMTTLKKRR